MKAQKILAFDKRGKIKRVRFIEGDFLQLKLKSGELVLGQINQIQEDSILVGNRKIAPTNVKSIRISKDKRLLNTFSNFLLTGAIAYFPLVTVNRTINDDSPLIKKSTIGISGSMLIGAVLLKSLNKRQFRISENRPLKIIDISL